MNATGMTHDHAPRPHDGAATDVVGVDGRSRRVTPLDGVDDPAERSALARLRARSPIADPMVQLGVAASRVPEHVAIIMDGNGRWARRRQLPRPAGHKAGAPRVRDVVTRAGQLGVGFLTLYSFSTENWRRPADEVGALMDLYVYYMARERESLVKDNVRLVQIGRRDRLSAEALAELDKTVDATAGCTGLTLVLAVNYSSRDELTDAARAIAERVRSGQLDADAIDQDCVARHLYTAGMPDPDVLIRTGGEMRVSNYLLWQISYAELVVTPTLWPDFDADRFDDALREYAARERRFGGIGDAHHDDAP